MQAMQLQTAVMPGIQVALLKHSESHTVNAVLQPLLAAVGLTGQVTVAQLCMASRCRHPFARSSCTCKVMQDRMTLQALLG